MQRTTAPAPGRPHRRDAAGHRCQTSIPALARRPRAADGRASGDGQPMLSPWRKSTRRARRHRRARGSPALPLATAEVARHRCAGINGCNMVVDVGTHVAPPCRHRGSTRRRLQQKSHSSSRRRSRSRSCCNIRICMPRSRVSDASVRADPGARVRRRLPRPGFPARNLPSGREGYSCSTPRKSRSRRRPQCWPFATQRTTRPGAACETLSDVARQNGWASVPESSSF